MNYLEALAGLASVSTQLFQFLSQTFKTVLCINDNAFLLLCSGNNILYD